MLIQIIAKLLILFILFMNRQGITKEYKSPKYVIYANELQNDFIKKIEKELKFICCGSGGGMPYDIEEFSVGFNIYQYGDIIQARELEVLLTEKFLNFINSNEKIKPYLREYPFTINNKNIYFFCREK